MVLPKWLADSIRRDQGVILDYEVQRALRGSAKRIWVQLESHTGWTSHRLAREDGELEQAVRALTDGPASVTVEPAEDEDAVEVETVVLPLTAEVYEAFGLTHANRKRDLEAACASILATDRTYLRAEVRPSRAASAASSFTSRGPPGRCAASAIALPFACGQASRTIPSSARRPLSTPRKDRSAAS